MIKSVDDSVGRVLQTLDELGLAGSTCVFFFSDNGGLHTVTDNAPLRMGKGYPYEGGIREAMAVCWPGTVPAGVRSAALVSSIDFFPTILSLAGCSFPGDRIIDGLNLAAVLAGRRRELPERALFWHFPHYWWGDRVRPWSVVRSGDWKLIRFYEDGREELYNIAEDESESNDLAASRPGIVGSAGPQVGRLAPGDRSQASQGQARRRRGRPSAGEAVDEHEAGRDQVDDQDQREHRHAQRGGILQEAFEKTDDEDLEEQEDDQGLGQDDVEDGPGRHPVAHLLDEVQPEIDEGSEQNDGRPAQDPVELPELDRVTRSFPACP